MVTCLPWVIICESNITLPVHRVPLVLCLVSGWLRSALTALEHDVITQVGTVAVLDPDVIAQIGTVTALDPDAIAQVGIAKTQHPDSK